MRTTTKVLAMFLAAAWMFAVGASAALAAEMCPMGGAMIKTATDRDKALAWAKSHAKAAINDDETAWSVLTRTTADAGIAILLEPGQVFFGVAGRGGEAYPRDIERAFGPGFAKLKEAMGKTLADLVAAGAVKLEAADIQALAGAAGRGVLEKGASGWALTTRDCQAVDLPASGL
jgi:hypothetical protein